MHGLGNDFVMVNTKDMPLSIDIKKFVKKISHRNLGIGCDQMVLFTKSDIGCEIFIYNCDGSIATACGNAYICLTCFLASSNSKFVIISNTKTIECTKIDESNAKINLGRAKFSSDWIPGKDQLWALASRYNINLNEIICVDVGNPHLVLFSNHYTKNDKNFIGKELEYHELFPQGVNINFVEIKNQELYLEVWERGVGFTLACGSGACASYAAAFKLGLTDQTDNIIINFPLGLVSLTKDKNNNIIMKSTASTVSEGVYYYDA